MSELLTIKEAGAYLKVSVETLRKWRAQGRGPKAVKLGRHLRYRPEDIDQWIKEQEGAQ
jgi:excisionase family DNA binding protein